LQEIEKELKKRFKAETKKTLKLKKVRESRDYEKVSRIGADNSWVMDGVRSNPRDLCLAKFLVRDRRLYDFSVE
jgi:hypothetical protein